MEACDDDRGEAEVREQHAREWRSCDISIGEMLVLVGLVHIEWGVREQSEPRVRRAVRPLLAAVDRFYRAGMGRRAKTVLRLLDRLQRAYVRHTEGGGGHADGKK